MRIYASCRNIINNFEEAGCVRHRRQCARSAVSRESLVLGIESSCDDTGVAVVSSSGRVYGEALATQEEVHQQWGGVVPSLAQAAHQLAISRVVEEAMAMSGIQFRDLDAIAVTVGPGLSLCLRVGVGHARRLASVHNLPVVPCHHMEAHALVARLGKDIPFPFLCMLVSGGHNLILIVRGVGDYIQVPASPLFALSDI
jgi:N6-L-threonylcarbamoyladenine synthase